MPGKIMARSRDEARTLGRGDARGGAAIAFRTPLPHFNEDERGPFARDQIDLAEAAARLYACLHAAAGSNRPRIAVAAIPDEEMGRAINDRLRRAAA